MRVTVVGAHPDDAEVAVGGLAAMMADAGHTVTFLSMCAGELGHHAMTKAETAARRRREAEAGARALGASYDCLDLPECAFDPTPENRARLVARLRAAAPDVLVTHPPGDYHVDHRHTSTLVNDALFLLQVPKFAPEAPALRRAPRLFYAVLGEAYLAALEPAWVAPTDAVFARRLRALDCHASQFYEWLPWVENLPESPPDGAAERLDWLARWRGPYYAVFAERYRARLDAAYGEAGRRARYAEALFASPFSGAVDAAFFRRLLGGEG